MIKITYHRDINRVAIEGHAHYAEEGKDLVCASATILAYTLSAYVRQKAEEGACWCDMGHFNKGDCIVSCIANEGYKERITEVFDVICKGLEGLAEQFPEFVSYEIK